MQVLYKKLQINLHIPIIFSTFALEIGPHWIACYDGKNRFMDYYRGGGTTAHLEGCETCQGVPQLP
jgi:hypothetical protein